MTRLTAALILFFSASTVQADNPCVVLGINGAFQSPNNCVIDTGYMQPTRTHRIEDAQLLAKLSNQLAAQNSEISALRAELKTAVTSLTLAVDALAKVGTGLVAQNQVWQANTLKDAIERIDKMPVIIAKDPVLQQAIEASVRAKLLLDPAFAQAVAQSGAK